MSLPAELITAASTALSAGAVSREQICALQDAMAPHRCQQPEPIHMFAPGMYLRELTVPAGMLIVGKIHRHAHFLMVLSGRAEIVSEFGRMSVSAGHVSVSPAGVKRAVLAIDDTRFVTIHVNKGNSTDLSEIEAEHIEPEVLLITSSEGASA